MCPGIADSPQDHEMKQWSSHSRCDKQWRDLGALKSSEGQRSLHIPKRESQKQIGLRNFYNLPVLQKASKSAPGIEEDTLPKGFYDFHICWCIWLQPPIQSTVPSVHLSVP